MTWWKRLFSQRAMTTPLADAVRLRLPIPIVERTALRTSWRDGEGDVVSVELVNDPQLAGRLASRTVEDWFRSMAENNMGGLVEAEILPWRSSEVAIGIYKQREGMGYAFTGLIFMPIPAASLVWTVAAKEHGMTGGREAVVTAQLLTQGAMSIDSYQRTWAQDPYDPQYRALERVDSDTLRFVSDDARYDEQFPTHPLSKVRERLRRILAQVDIHEAALRIRLGNL